MRAGNAFWNVRKVLPRKLGNGLWGSLFDKAAFNFGADESYEGFSTWL